MKKSLESIHRFVRLLREALAEIFEESAYTRFLQRHGLTPGTDSYAEFLRERENTVARKPRCC
jgi:hypothetical protein